MTSNMCNKEGNIDKDCCAKDLLIAVIASTNFCESRWLLNRTKRIRQKKPTIMLCHEGSLKLVIFFSAVHLENTGYLTGTSFIVVFPQSLDAKLTFTITVCFTNLLRGEPIFNIAT